MNSVFRIGTVVSSLLACLSLAPRAAAAPCGDLGPRGDYRAQLRVLNCLTAAATADDAERPSLRAKIERGLREAYLDLTARPLLEDETAAWTELYRVSARLYPKKDVLQGDVPITFVNAHHYSLPFWIERSLKTELGALIHFDTHSDMEAMPRPDDVRAAVADLKAGRNQERAWHIIAHAAHRNAMPVTGAVLAAGVKDVIWAKPAWSHDPVDFVDRAFFYARPKGFADPRPLDALEKQGPEHVAAAFKGQASDFFMLHYDPADNAGRWLPRREREMETWTLVGAPQRPHADNFESAQEFRFSVVSTDRADANLPVLVKAVKGERFVLDIDLDYFVNMGAGGDTEMTDDPPSFGERGVQRREESDSALSIFNSRRFRAAAAAAERAIIERRIRRFRDALLALKQAGKLPSVVSIADSANLPFTTQRQGQEHSEFVPVHHVYWVQERVTAVIKEVFGDGKASGLASGPKARPAAVDRKRTDEPVIPSSHAAFEQVRTTVRDALYAALAWATGAATTHARSPHLSFYLSMIHAIAQHGPDDELRRAARAAGRVLARHTLDAPTLGPGGSPSASEVEEALRRVAFGLRYGATEAEVVEAGARWYAQTTGLKQLPDLEAETTPLPPSQALLRLGLQRVFKSGQEPNLCDVFLGSQATDGGFTIAEMPSLTRAIFGLAAVRGILGLVPSAAPAEPSPKRPWPELAITRGDIDDAVLKGVLFTVAQLGELPATDQAIDGLLLLRTATQIANNAAVSQLAAVAGRLLAGRVVVKLPQLVAASTEADQIVAFAELGLALEHFAVDAGGLRRDLMARLSHYPREQVLGVSGRRPLTASDTHRMVARAAVLTAFGLPGFSYDAALREALRVTGASAVTADGEELIERFNAVMQVALTASGFRQTTLDRGRFPAEWKFLDDVFPEVMGSRRVDLAAAFLETRKIFAEDEGAPFVRDLTWQLLHEQNPDGSWGRRAPEDNRLRMTWAAISALGDVRGDKRDLLVKAAIEQVGVRVLESRAAGAPAPGATAAPAPQPLGKPGSLLGGTRAAAPAGRGASPRVIRR